MKVSLASSIALALLLASFLGSSAFAFSTNKAVHYSSTTWQMNSGLPHSSVTAILQTRDGYLWVGTYRGLMRFDGVHFTGFDSPNVPEFKGEVIRALCQTRDGAVWIGSDKEGLSSYKDGEFTHHPLPSGRQVKTLFESRDGSLWIGTKNGLARHRNGHFTWFTKADGLLDNTVLAVCEDRDGHLLVGTTLGLTRYSTSANGALGEHSNLSVRFVRSLFCDHENNLWIGTDRNGIARLKKDDLTYFTKEDGVPDLFVNTVFEDNRGQLWAGTMGGLCRRVGDKFVTESNSEGTSYETIFCLTEDTEGSLWLGTREGLSQLRAKPFKFYTKQQGLSHNNIMAVREDSQGTLWAATWGGGLNGLSKSGEVSTYAPTNGFVYDLLLSICETRDGSLWLGGDYNGGLMHLKGGTSTRYSTNEGLVDSAVRVIYEDPQSNLWIGTSGALYLMKDGKLQRFTTADGLAGQTIRAISEDREGNLWIGTDHGLTRCRGGKFTSFTTKDGLSENQVIAIYEDRERNLWLGTGGGGLNRFKNGKFNAYTTKQGIFSDTVSEILEDDHDNLWMSCFSGVFRVNKKDLNRLDQGTIQTISCASYGKADGMSSVQCNAISKPAGWKGNDGRLWFPTTRGLAVIDPNSLRENNPPPVAIEEIIADNISLPSSHDAHSFIVPPGKGDLEFHYTALSFRAPEKNRFKYKLEGLASSWVDAGTRRAAYYNNLRPGRYRFRVIACNNDGIWNEDGVTATVVLLPHFWQTRWFGVLAAFTAIGLVAASVRYITWKQVLGKLHGLEQQHAIEKERTRIAQDMHDDLGARLTEILLVSAQAKKSGTGVEETKVLVGKISHAVEEISDNLDAIIWAVNPRNDSVEKFVQYICSYAQAYLETGSVRLALNVPETLPALSLSSEVRHNLYLIIKEALNNAVKYAQASEIRLYFQIDSGLLRIFIEDNGKGFSASTSASLGNGLLNMEERMKNIGGSFQLSSEAGKGTSIQLELLFPQ